MVVLRRGDRPRAFIGWGEGACTESLAQARIYSWALAECIAKDVGGEVAKCWGKSGVIYDELGTTSEVILDSAAVELTFEYD